MKEPRSKSSSASNLLQRVWKEFASYMVALFDFFFPRLCAGCDAHLRSGEKDLCIECAFRLPKTYFWDYPVNPIEELFRGRLPITWACAYLHFAKRGKVQRMLHRMKYEQLPEIGTRLGAYFAQELRSCGRLEGIDLIVPIPLHHTKLRRRGYNQSAFIARGMAEVLKCRVDTRNLVRNVDTASQTRKSRYDRTTNVDSIFEVKNVRFFQGKNVLLVDDVVTTGSTLESAGRELLGAGVKNLYIVALACPD
jgi:ComF family protein